MKKKICVFLFDGFSDWEIAYITPELTKNPQCQLVYFSVEGKPVTSMGGLRILPQASLADISPCEVDMLVLPGGEAWEKDENHVIDSFVKSLVEGGKPVAAICAATAYLGRKGYLNHLSHTSNDLYYLKGVAPQYSGEQYYSGTLAVSDGNIITANGIAPVEFAREVFQKLELYDGVTLEKWFQLFKNGVWSE